MDEERTSRDHHGEHERALHGCPESVAQRLLISVHPRGCAAVHVAAAEGVVRLDSEDQSHAKAEAAEHERGVVTRRFKGVVEMLCA